MWQLEAVQSTPLPTYTAHHPRHIKSQLKTSEGHSKQGDPHRFIPVLRIIHDKQKPYMPSKAIHTDRKGRSRVFVQHMPL
jgi:hypothetical protein